MLFILKNTIISANNYAGKFVPSMEEVTGSICVVTGEYYNYDVFYELFCYNVNNNKDQ